MLHKDLPSYHVELEAKLPDRKAVEAIEEKEQPDVVNFAEIDTLISASLTKLEKIIEEKDTLADAQAALQVILTLNPTQFALSKQIAVRKKSEKIMTLHDELTRLLAAEANRMNDHAALRAKKMAAQNPEDLVKQVDAIAADMKDSQSNKAARIAKAINDFNMPLPEVDEKTKAEITRLNKEIKLLTKARDTEKSALKEEGPTLLNITDTKEAEELVNLFNLNQELTAVINNKKELKKYTEDAIVQIPNKLKEIQAEYKTNRKKYIHDAVNSTYLMVCLRDILERTAKGYQQYLQHDSKLDPIAQQQNFNKKFSGFATLADYGAMAIEAKAIPTFLSGGLEKLNLQLLDTGIFGTTESSANKILLARIQKMLEVFPRWFTLEEVSGTFKKYHAIKHSKHQQERLTRDLADSKKDYESSRRTAFEFAETINETMKQAIADAEENKNRAKTLGQQCIVAVKKFIETKFATLDTLNKETDLLSSKYSALFEEITTAINLNQIATVQTKLTELKLELNHKQNQLVAKLKEIENIIKLPIMQNAALKEVHEKFAAMQTQIEQKIAKTIHHAQQVEYALEEKQNALILKQKQEELAQGPAIVGKIYQSFTENLNNLNESEANLDCQRLEEKISELSEIMHMEVPALNDAKSEEKNAVLTFRINVQAEIASYRANTEIFHNEQLPPLREKLYEAKKASQILQYKKDIPELHAALDQALSLAHEKKNECKAIQQSVIGLRTRLEKSMQSEMKNETLAELKQELANVPVQLQKLKENFHALQKDAKEYQQRMEPISAIHAQLKQPEDFPVVNDLHKKLEQHKKICMETEAINGLAETLARFPDRDAFNYVNEVYALDEKLLEAKTALEKTSQKPIEFCAKINSDMKAGVTQDNVEEFRARITAVSHQMTALQTGQAELIRQDYKKMKELESKLDEKLPSERFVALRAACSAKFAAATAIHTGLQSQLGNTIEAILPHYEAAQKAFKEAENSLTKNMAILKLIQHTFQQAAEDEKFAQILASKTSFLGDSVTFNNKTIKVPPALKKIFTKLDALDLKTEVECKNIVSEIVAEHVEPIIKNIPQLTAAQPAGNGKPFHENLWLEEFLLGIAAFANEPNPIIPRKFNKNLTGFNTLVKKGHVFLTSYAHGAGPAPASPTQQAAVASNTK